MRTLAIGDVHGCYDAMIAVLEKANVSESDTIIWLGDYVDRGPDSAKVINDLAQLDTDRNIFLRGNHEIMMLNARNNLNSMRTWASSGGGETHDSYLLEYGDFEEGINNVPEEHWDFLTNLRPFFETENHIFVHASLDADLELEHQFDDSLFWGRFDSIGPHCSGKHVVCGHSSQKDGIPKSRPHATCIDTWACGGAWLTCLDIDSGRYYQANQHGRTNQDWIANW